MKEVKRGKFRPINNKFKKASSLPKTRKDVRKAKRKLKKLMKKEHVSKIKNENSHKRIPGQFVKAPTSEMAKHDNDSVLVHQKLTQPIKKIVKFVDIVQEERNEEKKEQQRLVREITSKRKELLLKANEEEEIIIKKLEKQLGMKKMKSKNITKSFAGDGLDYLLEICDRSTLEQSAVAEKYLAEMEEGSDFDEDIAIASGQKTEVSKKKLDKNLPKEISKDTIDSGSDMHSDDEVGYDMDSDGESDEENIENDISKYDDYNESNCNENSDKLESLHSSDDEFTDDEMEEPDLTQIYSRNAGPFPDDEFVPGALSPIHEEHQGIIQDKAFKPKNTISSSVDMECDNDDEDCCSNEECSESYSDESFDEIDSSVGSCQSEVESHSSDESEIMCTEDIENSFIIVNGKTVNTYGRSFTQHEIEVEVDKCKSLDHVLDELDNHHKKVSNGKNEAVSPGASSKKRKKLTEDSLHIKKKTRATSKEAETNRELKIKETNSANEASKKYLESDGEVSSSDGSESEHHKAEPKGNAQANGIWEDIYGRKRDRDGTIIKDDVSKYIPPHFRKQADVADSEEVLQLKRQMKSILNKIAGSNMRWACSQIELLYNSNSRNAVNNALCDLWLDAIVQNTLSSTRMVAEHAMLIAVLQANVGTEIGAHFLQTLVKKFDVLIVDGQNLKSKKLENLISGLSYLYGFKIFHASLLFEILQKLMDDITEKNIECALIALRNVGGILRKDEPALLKTFIQDMQSKTTQRSDLAASGTRLKFLVDVLLAIKNNNLSKIPNYDPSYLDELKKATKAIVRRGNYVTPLNIKMDDLLKADERGKWWVVGSAWNGTLDEMNHNKNDALKPLEKNVLNKKLLELARQQRMNTDSRRAIFCIIMSAEDYIDAFEKLLHLGLKNQQEKDIIHVLIACCLQEKKYNPYYSVLAQKFCDYDRKFQLSIQFAIWDKLKEISDFSSTQLINLAQFLTHLFLKKGLPLSVLKVIHFAELNKPTLRLVRQTLLAILLNDCQETCLEVFKRIAISPKLHMFRESLRLFIRHFLLKNLASQENSIDPDKKSILGQRALQVDKIRVS